jgi:hypothetical protein
MPGNRFDAVIGNPPWVLYAGKGSHPIDPIERAFLEAVHGRAARLLSSHGLFTALAGRLGRPGSRVGLVLPTSVADAERYSDVRGAHDELCEPEQNLIDIGEGAFVGVFQPCMALFSTRRAEPAQGADGAPWKLATDGRSRGVEELLSHLAQLPKLPAELFGERGYRSSTADRGSFVKASAPCSPFNVPLFEGTSVREFQLLPATAFADASRLPGLTKGPKWEAVDVFVRQTAKYPIASPASKCAFRNSILAGFAHPPYTTGVLLAYLNSTPVRWLHFHSQRDAQQGMPQVKVGHLRALPAPAPTALAKLHALGKALALRNCGIRAEERTELDRIVAESLGIAGGALDAVLTWGRENPPPEPRERAPNDLGGVGNALPGLRKTRGAGRERKRAQGGAG